MQFHVMARKGDEPPDTVILPGESAKVSITNVGENEADRVCVTFSDANRIDWKYDLRTRRLSKLKHKDFKLSDDDSQLITIPRPRLGT